ncbi:hypothetical protein SO802_026194 [Lithocarpus litseifolius]|uniref:Uncharacterized protein n=1 Tax=Lithocarpus litseifolius TaxID=425828 RepID=A0AAW2BZ19_9ROSI
MVVGLVNSARDPLTNAFFSLGRDILATVVVDPTVCKIASGDPQEELKEANQDVDGIRRCALGHEEQRGHVPSATHNPEEGYAANGGLGPKPNRKNQNLRQSRKG